VLTAQWSVPNVGKKSVQPKLPWTTINAELPSDGGGGSGGSTTTLCLDHAQAPEISLLPCGPGDGTHPSDPYQRWVIGADASIHAYPDTSLCLTSHGNDDVAETNTTIARITLQYCDHSVRQSMAFGGVALGGSEGPLVSIVYGNAWLAVLNATFA
jgi:hypothetical protein